MSDVVYGQLDSEKVAKENETCRKIVSEVTNFGVTQRQLKYIIYLLALNIDDVEVMRELVGAIKELSPEIFVSREG